MIFGLIFLRHPRSSEPAELAAGRRLVESILPSNHPDFIHLSQWTGKYLLLNTLYFPAMFFTAIDPPDHSLGKPLILKSQT
jgi:hypothetical protein